MPKTGRYGRLASCIYALWLALEKGDVISLENRNSGFYEHVGDTGGSWTQGRRRPERDCFLRLLLRLEVPSFGVSFSESPQCPPAETSLVILFILLLRVRRGISCRDVHFSYRRITLPSHLGSAHSGLQ